MCVWCVVDSVLAKRDFCIVANVSALFSAGEGIPSYATCEANFNLGRLGSETMHPKFSTKLQEFIGSSKLCNSISRGKWLHALKRIHIKKNSLGLASERGVSVWLLSVNQAALAAGGRPN